MTGKERAGLRAMANTIQPIFQIGKGGISDAMVEQIGLALDARELIKITVLAWRGARAMHRPQNHHLPPQREGTEDQSLNASAARRCYPPDPLHRPWPQS